MKTFPALLVAALVFSGPAFAGDFRVDSPDLAEGGTMADRQVFNGFGCHGGNVAPALRWSGAPAATKSFAVTVYDPDAPTGSGWWHWVVTDLPATASGVSGRPSAPAVEFKTDFGTPGYGGPCPPVGHGAHRYIFTVWALDVEKLPVPADASPAMVGYNLNGHALAKATLTGRYGR